MASEIMQVNPILGLLLSKYLHIHMTFHVVIILMRHRVATPAWLSWLIWSAILIIHLAIGFSSSLASVSTVKTHQNTSYAVPSRIM